MQSVNSSLPLRLTWIIECDSTLEAAGAFSPTSFYADKFPPSVVDSHLQIVHLEALNLVHAVVNLLRPKPHNYIVQVNTDNAASQQVLELAHLNIALWSTD